MSKIEWTDITKNVVGGCDKVSPGCDNCYAIPMSFRQENFHMADGGTGSKKYVDTVKNGEWTGNINADISDIERVFADLPKTGSKKVFVNSMSDLFHHKVSEDFIYKVFEVMSEYQQHTFQVLTKRPERLVKMLEEYFKDSSIAWLKPPENIWIGITAENQKFADKRIPLLYRIPAAKRFISFEPMIGRISPCLVGCPYCGKPPKTASYFSSCKDCNQSFAVSDCIMVDWAIIGCESGKNRRPLPMDYVYSLVDQLQKAGVKIFIKQLDINGKAEKDIDKFPLDLQIQEFPS